MRLLGSLALAAASLVPSVLGQVYHTNSRWIVDSNNQRFKLRCVNWGGHLEANVPEGLQHQPVDTIAAWVASAGFNCVRLTYSIDMALSPSTLVSSSFSNAGTVSGVGAAAMNAVYATAVSKNPWLSTASTRDTFGEVITALGDHGVKVILDNHVSKAQWCCNLTDGNGWWDAAAGYNSANSRYFNTTNWLAGLQAMAKWAAGYSNVIGMSLRNELRAIPILQDGSSHADWYTYVTKGLTAVHTANPNLLIMVGGVNSATDSSFLRSNPLDVSAYNNKVVWEFHSYSFTVGFDTSDCTIYEAELGAAAGFLLTQGQAYTGPLWLSEFGIGQTGTLSSDDQAYVSCIVSYMTSNDADWSVWALQGDYYVREGKLGYNESYGMLERTWTTWQNPEFKGMLGAMWNVTQGP